MQTSPAAHALPHAPQWLSSFERLISQPLPGVPSQLPNPESQVDTTQRRGEVFAQRPVEFGSASVHAGPPPGVPSNVPHPHAPFARQPSFVPHATPQPPQLLVVVRLVSQPALALQSPKPASHAPVLHVPLVHVPVAFGGSQSAPHAPQLPSSFPTLVHVSLQQTKPDPHDVPCVVRVHPRLVVASLLAQVPDWHWNVVVVCVSVPVVSQMLEKPLHGLHIETTGAPQSASTMHPVHRVFSSSHTALPPQGSPSCSEHAPPPQVSAPLQ